MALLAPSVVPSIPKFQMKLLENQLCQRYQCLLLCPRPQITSTCSARTTKAQFDEPSRVKLQLGTVKEKLRQTIPESIIEFPWKKAEDVLLRRLLFVGQKVLKWSLLTLFIVISLSDVIYSMARNKELMIPLGLFVGYLVTNFLNEILLEMFQTPEEKGLSLPLVVIGCFFVLVKIISAFFWLQPRVFLLHVANGGLMQVLWLSRHFFEDSDRGNGFFPERMHYRSVNVAIPR